MTEVLLCLTVPFAVAACVLAIVAYRKVGAAIRNARLEEIGELHTEVAKLRQRVLALEGQGAPIAPAAGIETPPEPRIVSPAIAELAATPPPPEPGIALGPVAQATPLPTGEPAPATTVHGITPLPAAQAGSERLPVFDNLVKELRENPVVSWFAGSHLVVRVGIIVLFFGVAFLLKFAADMGWLSIELRLIGAALLGIVLVGVGWRLREKRRVYSLTLQGGGFGILYMTTFVAFRPYELLPAPLAFGLLVVVSAACIALSVIGDSKALVTLALIGGFASPVLVSTGEGSHIALFSYMAVLNGVILAITWFKAWRELNLIGFAFTLGIGVLWGLDAYESDLFWSVEAFLALFFVFYVAIAILFARRSPTRLNDYVDAPLVFGTPLAVASLQSAMVIDYGFEYGMAWSALAMGLSYLALGAALWRAPVANFGLLSRVFLALGALFTTLAVPFAFDPEVTGAIWAVEGAGLIWIGTRFVRRYYRLLGAVVQAGAGIALLLYWLFEETGSNVVNASYTGSVLLSLSALVSAYVIARSQEIPKAERLLFELGLSGWGLLWWFGGGTAEIIEFVPGRYQLSALVAFFALSCALGEWIGSRLEMRWLAAPALLLWAPAVLLGVMQVHDHGHLLAYGGWLAWPLALAVYYWALYRRDGDGWQRFYHAAGVWFIALIAMVESRYLAERWFPDNPEWAALSWTVAPVLLVFAISLFGRKLLWPIARHDETYVQWGLGPLVAVLTLWWFTVGLFSPGDSAPLPYLFALNPLSLAQLAVLAAAVVWLRRLPLPRQTEIRGHTVILGLVIWLSAEMARTVHQVYGAPFTVEALLRSELLQTVYSIVWTGLALVLMFGAQRRGLRWVWLIGAGLLGVTVVKLFLVDLSNTGTLARIVSFLVVGVLMLLIGYFAPIPPAQRTAEAEDKSTTQTTAQPD